MLSCLALPALPSAPSAPMLFGAAQWLLDRPNLMKAAMLRSPTDRNLMFDSSMVPKLTAGPGPGSGKRLAGGWAAGCWEAVGKWVACAGMCMLSLPAG